MSDQAELPPATGSAPGEGVSRRAMLQAAPTAAGALALPGWLAGCGSEAPSQASGEPPAPAAFVALARTAAGGLAVDAGLAAALHADLAAHHPAFEARVTELTAALRALGGDGARLAARPDLAAIFADLLSGLYLGVTGPASARRCVAFESIESYALVAGALAPPSYALGAPGSWASPPPPLQPLPGEA